MEVGVVFCAEQKSPYRACLKNILGFTQLPLYQELLMFLFLFDTCWGVGTPGEMPVFQVSTLVAVREEPQFRANSH